MDQTIVALDNQITDQATKRMLQNVIDRKRKFDLLKKKHFWTTIVALVLGLLFVIYMYYLVVQPYSYSFFDMLTFFINKSNSLLYCGVVVGCYGYMLVLKKKTDKAEKEYHALRCEIVDRSKDLWKQEYAWKERHKIFLIMKEKYDINLFHENK
ncbi:MULTISPECIES: YpbF family protein [Bacillus]|uniref:YpbF family protein n=1 Tax=Bacillus TaxID=1386 RepID=UPI0002D3F71D|nr:MULTISPECIES: YpbF family protein [Bacillus]